MVVVLSVVAVLLGVARLCLEESWAAAAVVALVLAGPMTWLPGIRSLTTRARRQALLIGTALLSPLLLAGPSAWMTAALTAPCNPCAPHFCADVAPPPSASSPLQPAVAALALSLLAAGVAPWVGKKVASRADSTLSIVAPVLFAAASAAVILGCIVFWSRPSPAAYLERLPIAGVATEAAPVAASPVSGAAVSLVPYYGAKLMVRLSAGSASGSCGLYDPDARAVTVRTDSARRELVLTVAPGETFRCSLDSLECTPLTTDQLGLAARPSWAWALVAVVALASAATALVLRVQWSRKLRGTAATTVYRGEPDADVDMVSRIRQRICMANAHAVLASVLVVSAPLWRLILFR